MSIAQAILYEGKKVKTKYKYTSDPSVVRNPDGTLNYEDDKMDCSEFFLYSTKKASPELYKRLIDQSLNGKEGGNTKTIQAGIRKIEGLLDLTKLKQSSPQVGDWILWKDHIEMIEEVTDAGRYLTLGANGKKDTAVPKNIDCRNFDSVKKIAEDFLGIWTPKLPDIQNLEDRILRLEETITRFSPTFFIDNVFESQLADASQPFAPISNFQTSVHLNTNNPGAKLSSVPPAGQAFPLNEPNAPFNFSDTAGGKIDKIREVINFLKVSDANHKRYISASSNTFCNIYAYDLAYLMGRDINKYFIPRVWWNSSAIASINNGTPQVPLYGTTVKEMLANDLYDWFDSFGANFGWLKQNDLNELQEYVNSTGEIGIIVGKKPGGHGHITVVVPEQSAEPAGVFQAIRDGSGRVINPLQSQAGSRNFEYGNLTIGTNPWFLAGGHISGMYIFNKL